MDELETLTDALHLLSALENQYGGVSLPEGTIHALRALEQTLENTYGAEQE